MKVPGARVRGGQSRKSILYISWGKQTRWRAISAERGRVCSRSSLLPENTYPRLLPFFFRGPTRPSALRKIIWSQTALAIWTCAGASATTSPQSTCSLQIAHQRCKHSSTDLVLSTRHGPTEVRADANRRWAGVAQFDLVLDFGPGVRKAARWHAARGPNPNGSGFRGDF